MLKLIYNDAQFGLEYLADVRDSLEAFVTARCAFTLRLGQSFWFEPSQASFLLPITSEQLTQLEAAIVLYSSTLKPLESPTINFCRADQDNIEVSLKGIWIANDPAAETGIIITSLPISLEVLLHQLWIESQASVTSVCE